MNKKIYLFLLITLSCKSMLYADKKVEDFHGLPPDADFRMTCIAGYRNSFLIGTFIAGYDNKKLSYMADSGSIFLIKSPFLMGKYKSANTLTRETKHLGPINFKNFLF